MLSLKNYINGVFRESESHEWVKVSNPATEEVIGQVPKSNEADVDLAVAAAKEAFPAWSKLSPQERKAYLVKILEGIKERQEDLADCIVAELGATYKSAHKGQLPLSINEMSATLEAFDDYEFETTMKQTKVVKEACGVVACITPWNYPLNQIQRKLTPALLAGNTVVVKPASLTPLTALKLAEIIDQAGLPKGVVNIITGSGSEVGGPLSEHPDVAVVSFTGSTEVGAGLYHAASDTIKKLVLELGGKSALVLLEGGDVDLAVKQTMATLISNCGQTCSALTRLIVPESMLDEVKDALVKYRETKIRLGDPRDPETTLGSMVSKDQLETVLSYIEAGKEAGANILYGGHRVEGEGAFVEATVFTEVTNDMTIAQEEIFGPVLCVITYQTVEEAIAIANDSSYGLSGAVVGPQDQAEDLAHQLRTGNVFVNNGDRNPLAPFGGYKESGLGRENGLYGIDDYVEIKAIFL